MFNLPPCGPESYRFTGLRDPAPDANNGLPITQAGLAQWTFRRPLSIATHVSKIVAAYPGDALHPGIHATKPTPELKPRPRV